MAVLVSTMPLDLALQLREPENGRTCRDISMLPLQNDLNRFAALDY